MRKELRVLIVSLCVIILVAILLIIFLTGEQENFEKNVTITTDGKVSETLTFEKLDLKPGESVEYTINVKCAVDGEYDVLLEFVQTKNGGISPFVNVDIDYNGNVKSERLDKLFLSAKAVELVCTLSEKEVQQIKIKYTMPYEVENEAEDTWSIFNVVLTATHR